MKLLLLAEFEYNNILLAATDMTSFFGNYCYHPFYEIEIKQTKSSPEFVRDYQNKLQNLNDYLRTEIKYTNTVYAEQIEKDHVSSMVNQVK